MKILLLIWSPFVLTCGIYLAVPIILQIKKHRRFNAILKDADNAMRSLQTAKTIEDLEAKEQRVQEILEFARVVWDGGK